jgi:hypothetical protein
MAYTRQTWIAREGVKLNKFTKANETTTTVELTNAPDSITVEGTAFTASRMNNIEAGIGDSDDRISRIETSYPANNTILTIDTLSKTYQDFADNGTDVYAVDDDDVYKSTGGIGTFVAETSGITTKPYSVACIGDDVYIGTSTIRPGGANRLYKQTGGTGSYELISSDYSCLVLEVYDGELYIVSANRIIKYNPTEETFTVILALTNSIQSMKIYNDKIYFRQTTGLYWCGLDGTSLELYDDDSITQHLYTFIDGYIFNASEQYYIPTKQKTLLFGNISNTFNYPWHVFGTSVLTGNKVYGLFDNTINMKASFTLPEHFAGNRLRILADADITVTMPSGQTLDGAATVSLLDGQFIEIEKVTTTEWIKTGGTATSTPTANQLMQWGSAPSGTFTPTLTFGGASTGITYSVQVGSYQKIGRTVTFMMRLSLTSKGTATGDITITGLPSAIANLGANATAFSYAGTLTYNGMIIAIGAGGSTGIILQQTNATTGAATNLNDTNASNISTIIITGTYISAT